MSVKILDKHQFPRSSRNRFPEEWFDGSTRRITVDELGESESDSFLTDKRQSLRKSAERRGLVAKFEWAYDNEGNIVALIFQATKPPKAKD